MEGERSRSVFRPNVHATMTTMMATRRMLVRQAVTVSSSSSSNFHCRIRGNHRYQVTVGAPAVRHGFHSSSIDRSPHTKQQKWLHAQWIQASSASSPSSSAPLIFLHGLLGNGRNVRTFAQRLTSQHHRPGLLLDLPGHGASKGMNVTSFHETVRTIQTTLRQQLQLDDQTKSATKTVPITIIGHSMGGRLALQYAYEQLDPIPERVWLLDCAPGAVNSGVAHVLQTAQTIVQAAGSSSSSKTMLTRNNLTKLLVDQYHLDAATAQWLASSYDPKHHDFSFDLETAFHLVDDFGSQDFLGQVQTILQRNNNDTYHQQNIRIDLIRAGKNQAWHHPDAQLTELEAMQNDHFRIHVLPEANHWVHMDDLEGLLNIMKQE